MSPNLHIVIIIIVLIIDYSKTIEILDVCKVGWKCVHKCCPEYHLIFKDDCVKHNNTTNVTDFSEVLVYNENLERTGKSLTDVFKIVKPAELPQDEVGLDDPNFHPYLLESGQLIIELITNNAYQDPLSVESFCVDSSETNNTYAIVFRVTIAEKASSSQVRELIISIAAIISSIFLALVLAVYTVFSSLRNLYGKIIMSLAASQMAAHITLTVIIHVVNYSEGLPEGFCLGANFLFYFFILGSFFWMNILSYDIWKQFRSKQLRSYREERGEYRRKFIAYSIYAWGTPLLMATALICLDMDYIDVRSKPRFLKPNIIANRCFFGKYERLYYLYIPMLILIGANWVFFCMTGYLIWKTKRACRGVGMNSTPNNIKHRLIIFLRLSLVMGISWVLEVVSSMKSDSPVWYITDLYNIMLGVGIFIITVCNQRVYKLVKQRFGRERTYISKSAKINSDTTQESSLADDRSNDTQMKLINKETARVLPESNV